MPITRMNRSAALAAIGNSRVRHGINLLQSHISTAYEQATAAGTATGLNTPNRVRNSATLVAEPNLSVDIIGQCTYLIRCRLGLALTAANGIKLDFAAGTATIIANTMGGSARFWTTGSNDNQTAIGPTNGIPFNIALTALNTSVSGGTTNTWTIFEAEFTAQFNVGGTLQIEFAQASAGATNTDILPGSYLIAIPLDPINNEA